MIADQRLFLNADKSAVVNADDPSAAFLLATVGDEIPAEFEALVGVTPKPSAESTPKPTAPKPAAKRRVSKKG